MKKILTTITFSMLLLVMFSYSAKSQLSVRAGAGYMFPMAGGLLATESTNGNPSDGVYGTLGKGLAFGADLDYKLCTCFGLELGARYWDGSTIKSTSTSSETGNSSTDETDAHLNDITISLGEFYDFCCDDGKIVPYLGFGADIAVSGK